MTVKARKRLPRSKSNHDSGYSPSEWAFDPEVTRVFDDMLKRSIPQYEIMRQTCLDLANEFIVPDSYVVDLGCSRGEALAPLVTQHGALNKYIGVEVSPPMLEAARTRFGKEISDGVVSILDMDLRKEYPDVIASVTQAILVIQFVPIEYRSHLLKRIYEHTRPGGAFIMVEKILGSSASLDQLLVQQYYKLKSTNGYSGEEIERKRLSLEGKLVPVTTHWDEDMLRSAGFQEIECFWRWMNFCGWIAIRR